MEGMEKGGDVCCQVVSFCHTVVYGYTLSLLQPADGSHITIILQN